MQHKGEERELRLPTKSRKASSKPQRHKEQATIKKEVKYTLTQQKDTSNLRRARNNMFRNHYLQVKTFSPFMQK